MSSPIKRTTSVEAPQFESPDKKIKTTKPIKRGKSRALKKNVSTATTTAELLTPKENLSTVKFCLRKKKSSKPAVENLLRLEKSEIENLIKIHDSFVKVIPMMEIARGSAFKANVIKTVEKSCDMSVTPFRLAVLLDVCKEEILLKDEIFKIIVSEKKKTGKELLRSFESFQYEGKNYENQNQSIDYKITFEEAENEQKENPEEKGPVEETEKESGFLSSQKPLIRAKSLSTIFKTPATKSEASENLSVTERRAKLKQKLFQKEKEKEKEKENEVSIFNLKVEKDNFLTCQKYVNEFCVKMFERKRGNFFSLKTLGDMKREILEILTKTCPDFATETTTGLKTSEKCLKIDAKMATKAREILNNKIKEIDQKILDLKIN